MNYDGDASLIAQVTKIIGSAQRSRQEISPLTDEWPGLDADAAYAVQERLAAEHIDRGDPIIGYKLGLTSRAKQVTMNVDEPIVGFLTANMYLPASQPLSLGSLIHPRLEPEIVFVLGEDLAGPGLSAPQAMRAVASVHAGVEIIDSRFKDFRFTLPDVVADNTSAARFAVDPTPYSPWELNLALEACAVHVNGNVIDSATGAAVLGNPAEALAFAANHLGARGRSLKAGHLVLTGALTDARAITAGDHYRAQFSTLGTLDIAVKP